MMTQQYIAGLKALAPLNPNKFTVLEVLALERIEDKVYAVISWVDLSVRLEPEKATDRVKALQKYYHLLLSCCEMLSSSDLLKPVKGHVIQRDRKRIYTFIELAEQLEKKYSFHVVSTEKVGGEPLKK